MKMNVKKKLLLSFSAVLILLIILSSITYFQLQSVDTNYSTAIDERLEKISITSDMVEYAYQEQASIQGYLITGSEEQITSFNEASLKFKELSKKMSNITYDQEA